MFFFLNLFTKPKTIKINRQTCFIYKEKCKFKFQKRKSRFLFRNIREYIKEILIKEKLKTETKQKPYKLYKTGS